jgi:hypothetical protein
MGVRALSVKTSQTIVNISQTIIPSVGFLVLIVPIIWPRWDSVCLRRYIHFLVVPLEFHPDGQDALDASYEAWNQV